MPHDRCPNCLYKVDAATCLNGERSPRHGDFALCLNCGQLNVYGKGLIQHQASVEEESELDAKAFSEVRRAQKIIHQRGIFT